MKQNAPYVFGAITLIILGQGYTLSTYFGVLLLYFSEGINWLTNVQIGAYFALYALLSALATAWSIQLARRTASGSLARKWIGYIISACIPGPAAVVAFNICAIGLGFVIGIIGTIAKGR